MSTLVGFVILYLLVSIGIGLYAATRVHNSADYAVAGHALPLYMVIATVFATWFGSETVLGISARFITDGLRGVVEDPFGSSACLILVGLFFARKLYKMNLLTIGDFYRRRYNRTIEGIVALCIVVSYLGWVAAQITALGLVFNVLSEDMISMEFGMGIGAFIVLLYTLFGGMWSVALTDFFQMIIIVIGLVYIAFVASDMAGGFGHVINHAKDNSKFTILPSMDLKEILTFIAAAVTMMFGSIPQQDVFQRVMSARTAKEGSTGSILGGSFYFIFAFVPMFLAYSATLIDPEMVGRLIDADSQMILPTLILNHMPVFAQVMFFGALLSAIMSTASGTLLAPSITLTHNIIGEFFKLTDEALLRTTRVVVVLFSIAVTCFALYSRGTSIYEMVGNAYKITLVGAFVPLVMGLYWRRASSQGAFFAVVGGLVSWILAEMLAGDDTFCPPQLLGLIISFMGMIVGSYLAPLVKIRNFVPINQ